VNGASRDASKELIIACLLEKKIFQQYAPGDRTPSSTSETLPHPAKFGLNDKFHLINVFFQMICVIVHSQVSNLLLMLSWILV
jgi:hypothetical protein